MIIRSERFERKKEKCSIPTDSNVIPHQLRNLILFFAFSWLSLMRICRSADESVNVSSEGKIQWFKKEDCERLSAINVWPTQTIFRINIFVERDFSTMNRQQGNEKNANISLMYWQHAKM